MNGPEEMILKLESIANVLRGMTLDRRIPEEVRTILRQIAEVIDTVAEDADAEMLKRGLL